MIRHRIIEITLEDLDEHGGEVLVDTVFNSDLEINIRTALEELNYGIDNVVVRNKEDGEITSTD